jgi:hypothetical protein
MFRLVIFSEIRQGSDEVFGKKLIAKGHFLKPLYVEDGAFIRP